MGSGKKAVSIRKLLAEKQYDKLLMLELEKERIMPNREPASLVGQFVLLYDLLPQTVFSTMLFPIEELKVYFEKFLEKEKNITGAIEVFKFMHHWGLERTSGVSGKYFYLINSSHRLNLLDGDKND